MPSATEEKIGKTQFLEERRITTKPKGEGSEKQRKVREKKRLATRPRTPASERNIPGTPKEMA